MLSTSSSISPSRMLPVALSSSLMRRRLFCAIGAARKLPPGGGRSSQLLKYYTTAATWHNIKYKEQTAALYGFTTMSWIHKTQYLFRLISIPEILISCFRCESAFWNLHATLNIYVVHHAPNSDKKSSSEEPNSLQYPLLPTIKFSFRVYVFFVLLKRENTTAWKMIGKLHFLLEWPLFRGGLLNFC